MVETLWLVKNGVPWDIAMNLEPDERLAYVVIMGTFEGGKWDWATRTWRERH